MFYVSADARTRRAFENAQAERGEMVRGAFARLFRKAPMTERRR